MAKKIADLISEVINQKPLFEAVEDDADKKEMDEAKDDSKKKELIKKAKAWMKANNATKEDAADEFGLSVKDLYEAKEDDSEEDDMEDDDELNESNTLPPKISPAEAQKLFNGDYNKTVTVKGFEITMDGPMNSPKKFWAPVATADDGTEFYTSGEPGDSLKNAKWIKADNTNESLKVSVRKVTKEDFDVSTDLEAIFGTNESLSEDFQHKVKMIYEASVIAKSNKVIAEIHSQLKEAYVNEKNEFVSELTEAYNAKVFELEESVDRYLDKIVEDWKKENELSIETKAKTEITESFMSDLKSLFEKHYINMPDEKYDVLEGLQNEVDSLKEALGKEISRNVELREEIKRKETTKVVTEMTNGLAESQKEKFMLLAESIDSSDDDYMERLKEIKRAYFSKSTRIDEKKYEFQDDSIELHENVIEPRYSPDVTSALRVINRIKR